MSHDIKVGSMVLLTDERSTSSKLPLARVTQLHPGTENLTRVVTLKTATTQLIPQSLNLPSCQCQSEIKSTWWLMVGQMFGT